MIERIMTPIGSCRSENAAVSIAHELALAHGADVSLVQVLDFNILVAPHDGSFLWPSVVELVDAVTEEAGQDIMRLRDQLSAVGIRTESAILAGTMVPALLRYASEWRPDLVVMGADPSFNLARMLFRSVPDQMALDGPAPVLIVPAGVPPRSALERALVPLDGSLPAEEVLPVVEILRGRPLEAVRFLQVIAAGSDWDSAEQYLETLAEQSRRGRLVVEADIRVGRPGDIIRAAARDVDIVMMTTRGAGCLRPGRYGHVARSLACRPEVPLLLVRPPLWLSQIALSTRRALAVS